MIKKNIFASILCIGLLTGTANAEDSVIGSLDVESSAIINPGPGQQKIGSNTMSYLRGDVISTIDSSGANLVLSSGLGVIAMSANSRIAINSTNPLQINIDKGAVRFSVANSVKKVGVVTPLGSYDIKSNADSLEALVVFEDSQLSILPTNSDLLVESQLSGVITSVNAQELFVTDQNSTQAGPVDVQLLGGGTGGGTSTLKKLAIILAGLGVGYGVYELLDDDDDPPASPVR